ncbi:anaphase promoting complex subunit 3 [Heterostelium album PN500]|uniref:Anaphase promoting complex subunit 3 n=1 Tax=Heterostelium pallidum (strain ATCC 26659 / Pp 5 / PN500) TaxID=670386 RepID=D3BKF9_HETP5|nr:anaphase promoting complex subunit 3 [Heterostelium album PN500]EFA78389.1 anaphase promoting complex subunit 3 [Heterostelium album PN500]|eukprot:XP_020430514.1 anaphase promoting complex subunit 3 [Heterostelium album PN500]
MDVILQQSINDCLNCNMLSNALFLAERLVADYDCDDNYYLLATIYYRQGRLAQAHSVLKKLQYLSNGVMMNGENNSSSSSSASLLSTVKSMQLLAQCSLEIGETMEAEYLLEESLKLISNQSHHTTNDLIDTCQIASIHYLLGLSYRQLNKKNEAIKQQHLALQKYPYLWVAFEQLCQLDIQVDPTTFYNINNIQQLQQQQQHQHILQNNNSLNGLSQISFITNNNNIINNNNNLINSNINNNKSYDMSTVSMDMIASSIGNLSEIKTPHQLQASLHHAPRKSTQSVIQFNDSTSFSSSVGVGGLNFDMIDSTPQQNKTPKFNLMSNLNSNNKYSNNYNNNNNNTYDISDVTPRLPNKINNFNLQYQQQQQQQHYQQQQNNTNSSQNQPIPMSFATPAPPTSNSIQFSTPMMTPSPMITNNYKALPEVIKKKNTKKNDNEIGIPFIGEQLLFESQQQQQQQQLQQSQQNENHRLFNNTTVGGGGGNGGVKKNIDKAERHVHIGGIQEILPDNHSIGINVGKPMTLDEIGNDNNNYNYNNTYEQQQNYSLPIEQIQEAHKELLSLFFIIATAYKYLYNYQCKEAIDTFNRLSSTQKNTGWILTMIGKAYFELVDYQQAYNVFEQIRSIEPYRLEGAEIYSTVLWHLKKEVELSYLANQLTEFDRLSAHAWCVVGNCFSLQKDHESALKTFKRAIQLDSKLTYAYTLCGHEYFSNDDLENAQIYYRSAIKIDPRHYNSWYGLGLIYFRQEKYSLAEYHFRKALSINGTSSVLYCYIASILFTLEQYHLALSELEEFKEIAPKEISIYILMGKVYKRLGQLEKAHDSLTIALDMGPENSNYIRSIIDKLYLEDEIDNQDISRYRELSRIARPVLSDERLDKLDSVLRSRTDRVAIVCDNVKTTGNVAAIIRSCEAMGIQHIHVIDDQPYTPFNDISKGTEKWVTVHRHHTPLDCVDYLKQQRYQIWSSDLCEGAIRFDNLVKTLPATTTTTSTTTTTTSIISQNDNDNDDNNNRIAIVFGNEKSGVTEDMKILSDKRIFLPMYGMVQSFNVSVSVGMTLAMLQMQGVLGGSLSDFNKERLRALWLIKSIPDHQLYFERHGIKYNYLSLFTNKVPLY